MGELPVSVVIPTCNRKARLLSLLRNLDQSSCRPAEVIIVDSGQDIPAPDELSAFPNLRIRYETSEPSVCIQRNTGIRLAISPWILLCDDDMELPADYLQKLVTHAEEHPDAGAVSGLWLERVGSAWKGSHPEKSTLVLFWKYIFQLSIWGEIACASNNFLAARISKYYKRKGNHISKAGWPVLTQFAGEYFITPVYSLGASLVKKEWLIASPYDEVLDRHGIGDNYGVAMGFPSIGIHVLNNAPVYHHQEPVNRLQRPLQYLRRVLALHYFITTKPVLQHIKKGWLLWSLAGNLMAFIFVRDKGIIRPAFLAFWRVARGKNPYTEAARLKKQRVEPAL